MSGRGETGIHAALRWLCPKKRGGSSPLVRTSAKQIYFHHRFIMFHVYILQSLSKKDKTYVGVTIKDIKLRLNEHNKGLSKYTNIHKPWKLVYFENFYCKLCADKREQFLKSGFGYRLRKLISENYKDLIK